MFFHTIATKGSPVGDSESVRGLLFPAGTRVIGAFAFLIFTTTRNRVASQLRRLKQPRYAIGLVLGLLYFYSLFFRRALTRNTGANPLLGVTVETIAPLFVVLLVSGIWLFGGDRSALAFTEAEVSMLLTAPVSRRRDRASTRAISSAKA